MTDKHRCKSCGEWLEGFDMCPECGMIQEHGENEQKPNSLLDAIYEDWRRENK